MMNACSWRACLVILSLAFIHTGASTQRQAQIHETLLQVASTEAQRPETLLQVASTEASGFLAEANLAFPDLPESNFIDAGPASFAFPDIPESNSIDPGPSSSEIGLPATSGSFLQLPPPSSFLHLQPLDPQALSGPQGQVEDGSMPSGPSPPLPSPLIPSTVTKLSGPAAQDKQSLAGREEGQRQRLGIELLLGMQKELTKLSREVGTLAARSATSPPRVDSGLHLVGAGGGDSQNADDRKAASDGKTAGSISMANPYGTTAATDAIGDATMYSKIGMIVPVALQIILIVAIVSCTLSHFKVGEVAHMLEVCLAALVFMIIADIAWVCVCLSGLMDQYVKQAVVISICVLLVVCNIVIIGLVAWKMVSQIRCIKAIVNVPEDLRMVKNVVKNILNKIEAAADQVTESADAIVNSFAADYDSSDEKEDDPVTEHDGVPIRITIVEARCLPSANMSFMGMGGGGSNAYCSCAVAGRSELRFLTKTVLGSADPKWNHRHVLKDFRPGDILRFKVWHRTDLLGKIDYTYQEYLDNLQDMGDITLDLDVTPWPRDLLPRKPQLIVRIASATPQHLETASKFNGTGL